MQENIIYEGPREVTPRNVLHWSRHAKELSGSVQKKALEMLEAGCLKYIGKAMQNDPRLAELKPLYADAMHVFLCLPLNEDEYFEFFGMNFQKIPADFYNKSEYIIYKSHDGTFECNCQGWRTKSKRGEIKQGGANCKHVLALYLGFKCGYFGREHGAETHHLLPDIPRGEIDG